MATKHLELSLIDPDKLVKANDLKEVTSPIFFIRDNIPNPEGLLSNEIFGISKDERANIFAYIDLGDWFINPLCYKVWTKLDRKIRDVVYSSKNFIINSEGLLEENENGETGIKFLRKNIDKINFRVTDSNKRDRNIEFIMSNKDKLFIRKMIVIPAYYRDINSAGGGKVGVGDINNLYSSLLISVRALKDSVEYGFNLSGATYGRVQDTLLAIYNNLSTGDGGMKLSSKFGIVRRANMRKTTDYGSRLVISAPELKVNSYKDLRVTMEYSAVPLASICVNFLPHMVFNIRRFFENEFGGAGLYKYVDFHDDHKVKIVHVKNYQSEFSDDRIRKEIDKFIHGYTDRFNVIPIPNEEGIQINMGFKGKQMSAEEYAKGNAGNMPITERDMTWVDVFYMAAVEVVKNKMILITRYPIDSYYNQFPTKVDVASTKKTEPMVVDNVFYPHYPKIRQEDIGKNSSNSFQDTLNMANSYLGAIGGDYDGD